MEQRERAVDVKAPQGGPARKVRLVGFPDVCPRCHHGVNPQVIGVAARSVDKSGDIEECLQCVRVACGAVFIAVYRNTQTSFTEGGRRVGAPTPTVWRYSLVKTLPIEPTPPSVPSVVETISPTFVETYGQALASEGFGLTQLTGIGLRKALEFLVKDFAGKDHPADKEKILKKALAKCIDDYIPDELIKQAAKRAAWLGNDETHYLRRWVDKDIKDLKKLIEITINGIANILLARQYEEDMKE